MFAAVREDGRNLEYASSDLQGVEKIVREAIKHSGYYLSYASEEIKKNKQFMLEALKQSGSMILFADDSLRKDKTFMLEAVKQNSGALQHTEYRANKEFVLDVLRGDRTAIQYAPARSVEQWLQLQPAPDSLGGPRNMLANLLYFDCQALCKRAGASYEPRAGETPGWGDSLTKRQLWGRIGERLLELEQAKGGKRAALETGSEPAKQPRRDSPVVHGEAAAALVAFPRADEEATPQPSQGWVASSSTSQEMV